MAFAKPTDWNTAFSKSHTPLDAFFRKHAIDSKDIAGKAGVSLSTVYGLRTGSQPGSHDSWTAVLAALQPYATWTLAIEDFVDLRTLAKGRRAA